MDLRDGGGRDRLAEFGKKLGHGLVERGFDHGDCLRARERRHAVLKLLEAARHPHAHDVGPRRQELPELHIGRAKPRHGLREPGARISAAPLDQAGEPHT